MGLEGNRVESKELPTAPQVAHWLKMGELECASGEGEAEEEYRRFGTRSSDVVHSRHCAYK